MDTSDKVKKKILYLYSDTGGGHRAAANSLISAVKQLSGGEVEQEAIDVFAQGSSFLNVFAKAYAPVIRYAPWLWRMLWFSLNNDKSLYVLEKISTPLILNNIAKILKEKKPDILVSVHPLVNHLSIKAAKKIGHNVPFITVGMDPVDLHKSWISLDTDVMVVATEEAKKICLAQGLPESKIKVLGIPIDPRFSGTQDKQKIRQEMGLKKDLYTVLVMGGGEGAGNIFDIVSELNRSALDMQLIVICGRNEALKNKLTGMNLRFPSNIIGFTNEVPSVMSASDIIITKGGPGAIFEAMAKDLPMIITSWLPGQEEGNITYVLSHRIGKVSKDPKNIVPMIEEIRADNSIKENIRKFKKPQAVFDIARLILDML
jgi:1,2-diacylglycerol 3-beta-galactosyltransferase